MDIRQLRCFSAIAEARSLATAARLLGVSQPALTKTLQSLERSVGFKLFDRRSRGVALTALGKEFLVRVENILAEIARTRSELDALRDHKGGELHIGVLRAAANARIPDAVHRFSALYPKVRLNIEVDQNSSLVANLVRGKFDLVVGVGEASLEQSRLHYEALWTDQLVFAVRSDHPLEGRRITPAKLAKQAWIMPASGPYRQRIESYFFAVGVSPPSPQIVCGQLQFIRAMLMREDFVSLLPSESIEVECKAGLLRQLPIKSPLLTRPIGLWTRRDQVLTQASAAFCELLRGPSL